MKSLTLAALLIGTAVCTAAPPTPTGLAPLAMQRGTTATFDIQGTLGDRPLEIWCSRPDLTFTVSADKPQLEVTAPAEAPPGLIWIRLHNAEGASEPLPLLIDTSPQLMEQEPNNHHREAQVVDALPRTIQGVLHKGGEDDTFRVALNSGEQLIASVAAHEAFNTPADCVVQILSADGFVLAQNDDDHGDDPLLAFTAPLDGDYFVRVFAFPADPNSTINFAGGADYRYLLTLTTGPYIDALTTPGGTDKPIGWNLTEGLDVAATPGWHWLSPTADKATSFGQFADGLWTIEPNQSVTAAVSAPGSSVTARLQATKGTSYRFRVAAQELGSQLDPVLNITDAAGAVIKEVDDKSREVRDVDLISKAPADGEFRLAIADRFGHAGDRYFFQLSVEIESPQVELTLAANRFVLKKDAPLEIPVTITRTGGFDQQIVIQALDLPEGVTSEPVTSEPKGDSSKSVKLILKADNAAAFNGPIRIAAFPDASAEATPLVIATTNWPIPRWKSEQVWLTVLQ